MLRDATKVQCTCSLKRLDVVGANKHFYLSKQKNTLSVTSVEYQKVCVPLLNREQCVKWPFGSLCRKWVILPCRDNEEAIHSTRE